MRLTKSRVFVIGCLGFSFIICLVRMRIGIIEVSIFLILGLLFYLPVIYLLIQNFWLILQQ